MTRPDRALEAEVVRRAQGRCEYCHFPEAAAELRFHIDHIIAEKHGGPTASANLAWTKRRISPRRHEGHEGRIFAQSRIGPGVIA